MALAAAFQRHLFAPNIHWRPEDSGRLAKLCAISLQDVTRAIEERPLYRAAPPQTMAAPISKSDSGAATYTFAVSSATPDRLGDSIIQSGIHLGAYKSNPVVLFQHDPSMVIGKALSIGVVGDKLTSTMKFNPASGFARNVEAAVRGGYIRATSIGFRPLDWTPLPHGGIRFNQIECLEYSCVSIPANPEALLVGMTDSSGKSVSAAKLRRERELELIRMRARQ